MILALYLQMVVWPCKFRPHLPEKYDRTVNSTKFLQIYSTSILTAGGDEAVMVNYFPVALTWMTRSWLMNLPEGSLTSWQELCRQFTANFESAYARPGNETDLHAVRQHPGGISVLLYPAVLSGSQYHSSYFQCFYCSHILLGCEGCEDAGKDHHA
jgi:hypothetical protein